MNYLWNILVMIGLYSILAMSLNLVVGYTGLISLCHAAFYGIGAYATALLMVNAGWDFFPALLAAIVLTVLLSFVIAIPSLRLKGDYFVLATLGFQAIVFSLLYNWVTLTKGPYGIAGIPVPKVAGIEIASPLAYALFTGVAASICGLVIGLVTSSPFGRLLKAVRDDETAAAALGKNVPAIKVTAFAFGAGIAAVAGGLFAGYARYIDPLSFTTMESIFILSIVLIGGAGNMAGPIVGAVLMVVMPEALRFLHVPDAIAANMRQIIYGLLLIALMRFRPQGIQGAYGFD